MQKLTATILASLAATAFAATANAGQSVWNHNGSQMLLESNGSQRTISYLHPRSGISAQPGQILFQGRRVGNRYEGTAYTFRRGCQAAAYRVSGRLGSETRIVLRGASPRRSGCEIIGYTKRSGNSKLVFSYMRKAGPDSYGTDANEPPADNQQQDGPVESPVQKTVKNIPGGKIIFRVQDEDAPAETPIRLDATAQCNDGTRINVIVNHRTCEFGGVRTLSDGSGFDIFYKNFGGGRCSVPDNQRIQTYDLCQ